MFLDGLCDAAESESFADASGKYFDNDMGSFTAPHAAALDSNQINEVMQGIQAVVAELS